MKAPCEECLKMAMCLGRMEVNCVELARWLSVSTSKIRGSHFVHFEKRLWNKDISTVNTATGEIRFKETIRDHYSALIVR